MSDGAAEKRANAFDVHLHLAGEDRAYLAGFLLGVESRRGSVAQFQPVIMALQRRPAEGWRHLYQRHSASRPWWRLWRERAIGPAAWEMPHGSLQQKPDSLNNPTTTSHRRTTTAKEQKDKSGFC